MESDILGREGLSVISLAQRLGENEVMPILPDPSSQQGATVAIESTGESDHVSVTADNLHPSTSRDNEDVTHRNPRSEDSDTIQVPPTDFDCDIGPTAGFEYQWMQLTFALQCALKQKNSKFYLATEMVESKKLDDVVLQYTKNDKTQVGRFVQVKYRTQEDKEISAQNLLAAKGDFSVPQYFRFWYKITKKDLFQNIKERNVILCTNMGAVSRDCLHENGIECITETTDPDPWFKLESKMKKGKKKSAWYKFVANGESNPKLYAAIEETLQCNQLAKLLAEHIHDRKPLSLDIDIFQYYHVALFEHVFDPETKMFRGNFLKNVNLSQEVKKFREIFLTEYERLRSRGKNRNEGLSELEWFGEGNNFSSSFGKSLKFISDPQLTDVAELSNQVVKLLRAASKRDYVVRIVREASNEVGAAQPIPVILDNIEKFSGHVLIKHEGGIKFSRTFQATGRQSSGSVEEFKKIVWDELGNEFDLASFKFEVEDDVICTERDLLTKDGMPSDYITGLRDEISMFLKEFTLAVNQPNIQELYEIISHNMHSLTEPFNTGKLKLSGEVLQSRLKQWFMREGENSGKKKEYLSYDVSERILDDMKREFNLLVTFRETIAYRERMTAHDVHFRTEMQLVESFLASDGLSSTSNRILELVTSGKTLLTASWAYATLEKKFTRVEDHVIFIDLDRLKLPSIFSTVKSAFDSKDNPNLLFVDCGLHNAEDYSDQLWEPLCKTMQEHRSKKIILITQEGKNMSTRFQIGHETHRVSDDNYSFKNLTVDTQNKILQTVVTKFQGHETKISFGDLLGISSSGPTGDFDLKDHENDLSEIIDSSTLLDLISGGGVEICEDLESFKEKDYYLDRYIHQVVIKKDILKDDTISDLFAISNTNDEHFSGISTEHMRKITILDTNREEEQFKAFCEENNDHNIHWLKENSGQYIWEKSVGDIKSLAKYRVTLERGNERATTNYHSLTSHIGLIDCLWMESYRRTTGGGDHDTDRISVTYLTMSEKELAARDGPVIISDTAGMGKSTMLSRLAWRLKEKQPDALVIKINLQHHVAAFEEAHEKSGNNVDNIDRAIEFLTNELLTRETDSARKLIGRMIKTTSNVALIFDGFDEISPDYETLVINLLETFAKHGIRRLFIATRPHTRETLEIKLQILSYDIEPFTGENQVEFLIKYWGNEFSSGQDSEHNIKDRIEKYAQAVVAKLAESINDQPSAFTGVPLQTQLVAEIFLNSTLVNIDSCEKFVTSNDDEPNLAGKIDLIYLYQQFVRKKFDVAVDKRYSVLCEKCSDFAQNPAMKHQKEHEWNRFFETHQKLAVDTLFDKDKVEKFPSLLRHPDILLEPNGIIVKFEERGRPQFGHRTYAEYLAATFLVDKLKTGDLNEVARKIFVADVILAENHQTMRAFINLLWAKEHPQDDTFGSGLEKFISNELRGLRNETILHVAAYEGHAQIIRTFLKYLDNNSECKKALYNAKDDYGNTAVLIATYGGCSQSLELLVEDGLTSTSTCDKVEHSPIQTSNIINSANIFNETPLCVAAARGELDAVMYLVDRGAHINPEVTLERTPLHEAVETGGLDIVKYLVGKGAHINADATRGRKPLHEAVETGRLDIVEYLVAKGAHINPEDTLGRTPLHEAIETGRLDIVKYLVGKGAHINPEDTLGRTPLHEAIMTGELDIVKYLVKMVADILPESMLGRTPLHLAAGTGRLDIVEYLVEMGARINPDDTRGRKPLHIAVETGRLDIVKYLVAKGAHINPDDTRGRKPLDIAVETGRLDIAGYLVYMGGPYES